jgi:hypothetical protein
VFSVKVDHADAAHTHQQLRAMLRLLLLLLLLPVRRAVC